LFDSFWLCWRCLSASASILSCHSVATWPTITPRSPSHPFVRSTFRTELAQLCKDRQASLHGLFMSVYMYVFTTAESTDQWYWKTFRRANM
jgi:hypothetical protein